ITMLNRMGMLSGLSTCRTCLRLSCLIERPVARPTVSQRRSKSRIRAKQWTAFACPKDGDSRPSPNQAYAEFSLRRGQQRTVVGGVICRAKEDRTAVVRECATDLLEKALGFLAQGT